MCSFCFFFFHIDIRSILRKLQNIRCDCDNVLLCVCVCVSLCIHRVASSLNIIVLTRFDLFFDLLIVIFFLL